jgi:hypothetical protein
MPDPPAASATHYGLSGVGRLLKVKPVVMRCLQRSSADRRRIQR